MKVTFAPRGIVQIDDAKLVFRNFSGKGDRYNREGDRNFAIVIPDPEIAEALKEEGWNVKIKPDRDEDELPFMYLSVKVKFNDRGPNVYLISGDRRVPLDEESIGCLDSIMIDHADLDIRPYDWQLKDGTSGRAAYLQGMDAVQILDRFGERHDRWAYENEYPRED